MQSVMFQKESDVLRQIAKASDSIRRKHKMIKSGREATERAMSDVFKPVVTPLQKLVTQSVKQEHVNLKELKKEEPAWNNAEDYDETFNTADDDESDDEGEVVVSTPDSSFIQEPFFNYKSFLQNASDNKVFAKVLNPSVNEPSSSKTPLDLLQEYLDMFGTDRETELDTSYGIRRLAGNVLMIGDSPVTFNNHAIVVKNVNYDLTPGLLELIFRKSPNNDIVTLPDMNNYGAIISSTSAHRKYYKMNKPIRKSNTTKFKKTIMSIIEPSRRKTGKALPRYMVAREKRRKMDYVYWDDPNELVDRLRLLYASQAAGNANHTNEIISIVEELREAGIIY